MDYGWPGQWEAMCASFAEGESQHAVGGIEVQGKLRGAGPAQPEVLALAGFAAIAIEAVEIAGERFRHE